MMAFPSDLAPVVGQQVTLNATNSGVAAVQDQVDLLIARAGAGFVSAVLGGTTTECDLVAKTVLGGSERGFLLDPLSGDFVPDDGGADVTDAALRALALGAGQEVTFTCVPPGSGVRAGIDRDEDGLGNGVESDTGVFVDAGNTGTNPAAADTDGDGFDDGIEVLAGSDPTNPASTPNGPSSAIPLLPPLAMFALMGALLLVARRRVT